MNSMQFNEKTTLQEVMELSGVEDVLVKYNVPCLGCPMAKIEMQDLTIGQICSNYGIDQAGLLADLNAVAQKAQ